VDGEVAVMSDDQPGPIIPDSSIWDVRPIDYVSHTRPPKHSLFEDPNRLKETWQNTLQSLKSDADLIKDDDARSELLEEARKYLAQLEVDRRKQSPDQPSREATTGVERRARRSLLDVCVSSLTAAWTGLLHLISGERGEAEHARP
jgi:hypothetical protein